jgi:adenosine deaminase
MAQLPTQSPYPWPAQVTELHVHLGGSVPLYRLWETAIVRGIRGLGSGYDEFIHQVKIEGDRIKDLDSYLEVYDTIELIQSGPDSVRESIIASFQRSYRTGGMVNLGPGGEGGSPKPLFRIGALELRLNPLKRTGAVFLKGHHAGLYDVDRVIKAACSAVEDVEIAYKGDVQAGLLFCFGRDMTFEANMALARKVALWRSLTNKIVGIDLAGSEATNSLEDPQRLREMKEVFAAAGNVPRTIHVGETPHVTVDTFVKTIEALEPMRVAHPISAIRAYWDKKDDRGLKLLKERDIACELCVKSNLLTRAVNSLDEYKKVLGTLDDFGIPYTFSTDAPSLQVTSLAKELMMLLNEGAATWEQVERALRVANERTFLSPLPSK